MMDRMYSEHLDFGLRHMTCFGQWVEGENNEREGLKWAGKIGPFLFILLPLAM